MSAEFMRKIVPWWAKERSLGDLFARNEGKLFSYRKIHFWVLTAILLVTFITIGFANGSLRYLERKMNDPFVNWVDIEVPYSKSGKIGAVEDWLKADSLKARYQYNSVMGYFSYSLHFWDREREGTYQALGRTIEIDDPLLHEILQEKIAGRSFSRENDIGLILTERFLETFHYDLDDAFVLMSLPVGSDTDRCVPIPIIAVVEELTGLNLFASTPYFYHQRFVGVKDNPFSPFHSRDILSCFVPVDSLAASGLPDSVDMFFRRRGQYAGLDPYVTPLIPDSTSHIPGFKVRVSFERAPATITELDSIFVELCHSTEVARFPVIRCYPYSLSSHADYERYDNLSVNFTKLDSVRAFKSFLSNSTGIQIDMADIQTKENLNLISHLTLTVSTIMIVISTLSICIFTSHMACGHLEKERANIGTVAAYGATDRFLLWVYLGVVGRFLLFCIAASLVLSWGFGRLGGGRLMASVLNYMFGKNIMLEEGEKFYDLLSTYTVLGVVCVIVVSLAFLYVMARRILSRSPGDLIYDKT